jgi:hypothetical protein
MHSAHDVVFLMQCTRGAQEVQVRWKDNKGINLGLIDAAQVIGINPAGGNNGVEQIAIFIALVPVTFRIVLSY